MRRTALIITLITIALGLIAAGVFFGLRGRNPEPLTTPPIGGLPPGDGDSPSSSPSPSSPSSGLSTQTDSYGDIALGKVLDYAVLETGEMLLLHEKNSTVVMVSLEDSASSVLGMREGERASRAMFSFDGSMVLVASLEANSLRWHLFNTKTQEWTTISERIHEPAWEPMGTRIAYIATGVERNALRTLDFGDEELESRTIFSFSAEDVFPVWKDVSHIFLVTRASALSRGSVFEVGLDGSVSLVFENILGIRIHWNADVGKGVVFAADRDVRKGGVISLFDDNGLLQELSMFALPEKCAFHKTQEDEFVQDWLVCALPDEAVERSHIQPIVNPPLPDSYERGEFSVRDGVYQINLTEGTIEMVVSSSSQGFDAHHISVSGETLYLINKLDGLVYAIPLAL